MQEGIATFMERPFTGVGAGQFKNYNPAGRKERWRETHNALIQVAAETGILGLLAFSFLILRAALAAAETRRMLSGPRKRGDPDPLASVLTSRDRAALYNHTVAMTAGLIGWFVCSMFASVAYSWTFYYVLALIVAAREMTRDRLLAARALRDAGQEGEVRTCDKVFRHAGTRCRLRAKGMADARKVFWSAPGPERPAWSIVTRAFCGRRYCWPRLCE